MPSALRFRLYPSRKQEERMLRSLASCRSLWNDALAHRRSRWQDKRISTSYDLQQWILTEERHLDPELGTLYSQVGQDVLHRLDRAFKGFFNHQSGYPKFKKFSTSGSFTYPQAYNGSVKPDVRRSRLYVSKIGNIPAVFHRQLPKASRMKTCTLTREPDGKWFASMVFEEVVPLQDLSGQVTVIPSKPVGVDLGLLSLIVTSDGEGVEHPRFLRKSEKRLKRLQRVFSHKKKGSKNRSKARQRVASQHAKVGRQRLDFNHKLSSNLVKRHDFIAFEDLRIENMVKNHRLAKSIQDAAWGQLITLTEYKTLKVGSRIVKVPPAYTTQECMYCGALNKISLDVREFGCIGCGRHLYRDHNAANVVLKRGLAIAGLVVASKVGQVMPDLKPMETRPLFLQTTGRASKVNEAGTIRPQGLEAHGLQP